MIKYPGIQKILFSSGVNLLFRVFGLASSFLSTLLITRLFGVSEFGNYSLVFTVCQACAMVFTLGIPNAMIKIVGNRSLSVPQAKQLVYKGVRIVLLVALLPTLFLLFFAGFLSGDIFHKPGLQPYFIVVAIALPLSIAHELCLHFFLATRNFLRYNLFMFVYPNILLVVLLYAFFHFGCYGHYTFLAYLISVAVVLVVESLVIVFEKGIAAPFVISARELLKTSSPMMFSGLLLYLLNWTDILMLGPQVDEQQIGIYNIAYKVGTIGFLVIVSVSTIITPKIAQLFGEGNLEELRKLVQGSVRLIALVSLPVIGVLMLLGSFILSLFSPEAVLGYDTYIIISGGVLFSAICGNVDQVLNMTNNHIVLRNITFGCFLLNVILNVVLIPTYGINGAAMASLITNVVLNSICVYFVKKRLGFSMINLNFRKP